MLHNSCNKGWARRNRQVSILLTHNKKVFFLFLLQPKERGCVLWSCHGHNTSLLPALLCSKVSNVTSAVLQLCNKLSHITVVSHSLTFWKIAAKVLTDSDTRRRRLALWQTLFLQNPFLIQSSLWRKSQSVFST